MATLVSLNLGLPKNVSWQDRTVHTGIWKEPVDGPRMVRRLNVEGDGQGDLNGHGGEQRALRFCSCEVSTGTRFVLMPTARSTTG